MQDCYLESGLISSFRFGDTGLRTSHAQKRVTSRLYTAKLTCSHLSYQLNVSVYNRDVCVVHGNEGRYPQNGRDVLAHIWGNSFLRWVLPGMRKSFRTLTRPHNDYLWQYWTPTEKAETIYPIRRTLQHGIRKNIRQTASMHRVMFPPWDQEAWRQWKGIDDERMHGRTEDGKHT